MIRVGRAIGLGGGLEGVEIRSKEKGHGSSDEVR